MDRFASLWAAAGQQFVQKRWAEARKSYAELLRIAPDHPAVHLQLSYVESYLGNYRKAREHALLASSRVADPRLAVDLVARLRTFNEARRLLAVIGQLGPVERIPIPALLECAAQLSYLNEQQRALALINEAHRGDPEYPPTLVARAQILMYLGRMAEAEADAERVVAMAPQIAQAWWLLARLRRQTSAANHVQAIRAQLARSGRMPGETALLYDALHKELDDLGDHAGAWLALEQACRAKRSTLKYAASDTMQLVDGLVGVSGDRRPDRAADDGRVPIFITGMHRSGTTLLEQLLDGHSDVRGVGELYDFTSAMRYATDHHCRGVIDPIIVERSRNLDFGAVGEWYLKCMEWRLGKERFFTDKLPSNFLNIGFICQALPQAKILHMVRDPIETCFSNLRELFSDANPYSYDQLELAHFYRQYRRLMDHWHEAYPGRILDVDYAELTRDTEAVVRRVSAFCGFEFEPEMLALQNRTRGVATASAVQVRDKVVVREQPKWKPYEQYLQPLIRQLRADGFVA